MTTLETALRNGNSTVNQRIKERFISQHVHANVNSLVEFVISQSYETNDGPFNYDDIENIYSLPEYRGNHVYFEGGTEDEREEALTEAREKLEECENSLEDMDTDSDTAEVNELKEKISEIEEEIQELEDLESESQEVFEWWKISSFLCEKLNELGHPVLSDENIWGRCTTGQAILLDYAITQICANMGILEGQESSWA